VKPKDRSGMIGSYETLMDRLALTEGLTYVSPAADASGFLRSENDVYPVLVRGFSFEKADGIYQLKSSIMEGSFPKGNEVMLGKELMQETGLAVGDMVTILTPLGNTKEVLVSGAYDLKVTSLNKSWVITSMNLVQGIFGYGNAVTSIEMQLTDPFEADKIAANISVNLPEDLKVDNWKALNASLLSGLNGQSISSLMIQVFVMISVILGIASVLAISVMQKSRQLGILKAMGIKNRTASLIFLSQGFILGLFGAMLGVLFGLGLAASFSKFALKPDGTPIIALLIDPKFISLSALIALIAATLAALIPARRSSKLDPMEVIKNG
jgi:lipoprotein-releasing system permease protein